MTEFNTNNKYISVKGYKDFPYILSIDEVFELLEQCENEELLKQIRSNQRVFFYNEELEREMNFSFVMLAIITKKYDVAISLIDSGLYCKESWHAIYEYENGIPISILHIEDLLFSLPDIPSKLLEGLYKVYFEERIFIGKHDRVSSDYILRKLFDGKNILYCDEDKMECLTNIANAYSPLLSKFVRPNALELLFLYSASMTEKVGEESFCSLVKLVYKNTGISRENLKNLLTFFFEDGMPIPIKGLELQKWYDSSVRYLDLYKELKSYYDKDKELRSYYLAHLFYMVYEGYSLLNIKSPTTSDNALINKLFMHIKNYFTELKVSEEDISFILYYLYERQYEMYSFTVRHDLCMKLLKRMTGYSIILDIQNDYINKMFKYIWKSRKQCSHEKREWQMELISLLKNIDFIGSKRTIEDQKHINFHNKLLYTITKTGNDEVMYWAIKKGLVQRKDINRITDIIESCQDKTALKSRLVPVLTLA